MLSAERTHGVMENEDPTAGSGHGTLLLVAGCHSAQCRFTSTETVRTVRDVEAMTATSTFTHLLSCDPIPFQFSVALRPQKP